MDTYESMVFRPAERARIERERAGDEVERLRAALVEHRMKLLYYDYWKHSHPSYWNDTVASLESFRDDATSSLRIEGLLPPE